MYNQRSSPGADALNWDKQLEKEKKHQLAPLVSSKEAIRLQGASRTAAFEKQRADIEAAPKPVAKLKPFCSQPNRAPATPNSRGMTRNCTEKSQGIGNENPRSWFVENAGNMASSNHLPNVHSTSPRTRPFTKTQKRGKTPSP